MTTPRVLALVAEENACTLWRTFQPFAELQRHGVFAHWKNKDDPELLSQFFLDRMPLAFDAVIFPRLSWRDWMAADRYFGLLRKLGLACILEMDDDVYSPAIVARQFNVHDEERAKGLEALEQDRLDRIHVLRQVDGVTVTTRRLQTIVGQYTDAPCEIVPNAIDVRWFKSRLRGCQRVVPPLTVGWSGGARYPDDLVAVAEAWTRIAGRFPEVTFVVQGHMAEVLIDAVPADRVRRLTWVPIEDYPRAMLNIDIACCAVAPKLFNTAKTPIKLWEHTLAGAACVVSPTLYGPVAHDGVDALVAETADQWETALARLIEDESLRRSLRRQQRVKIATQHSLEQNWWRWPAAWESIIEQFRMRPRLAVAS